MKDTPLAVAEVHPAADSPSRARQKEPWPEQVASFVGFFIYLLILKSFFLPLFIIPTGSMAETLYGEHVLNTCPNCGVEFATSWPLPRDPRSSAPPSVICPNCRWTQYVGDAGELTARGVPADEIAPPQRSIAGDRIFVHGWPQAPPLDQVKDLKLERWDVVVFKVPNDGDTNYIKRAVGLPGEQIEIIDGDLFVDGQIARKPPDAQRSLWFSYFDEDRPPRAPSRQQRYHPRWVSLQPDSGWQRLDSRVPSFDGTDRPRGEIRFVTEPGSSSNPGRVQDVYGYNGAYLPGDDVSDVRLSAEVAFEAGDGYFELRATKRDDRFIARLMRSGLLTLEHETVSAAGSNRTIWGSGNVDTSQPVALALSNADYQVNVLVDGKPVIRSTDEQYSITPEKARALSLKPAVPVIECAAEGVRLTLRHLLIERDVLYLSEPDRQLGRPANAGTGHPLKLGPDEYFCCGDNSPNSLDGRYWYPEMLGPHLRPALESGRYHAGTVPADQIIGQAFFVYWPGPLPLSPWGPNLLFDVGRARWIR